MSPTTCCSSRIVPPTLALADVDEEGVATYHFYAEATSAPLLTPGPLPEPATALVTGGLALALEPMAHHIERFVTEAGAGVMVVIDVNVRSAAITNRNAYLERLHTVLHRADVVKVSHEDLAYLEPEATAHDAAQSLLQRGARVVLVTNGAHDTTIVTGAGSVAVPVQSVSVVDTIGAGDTFTAGFVVRCVESRAPLAELSEPPTIVPMVQAAHAVAAAVVGKRGCDPPTRGRAPRRLVEPLTAGGAGGARVAPDSPRRHYWVAQGNQLSSETSTSGGDERQGAALSRRPAPAAGRRRAAPATPTA